MTDRYTRMVELTAVNCRHDITTFSSDPQINAFRNQFTHPQILFDCPSNGIHNEGRLRQHIFYR
ncbi:MAG: hypothetical protein ACLRS8_18290 [Parabacteroides merdae]